MIIGWPFEVFFIGKTKMAVTTGHSSIVGPYREN
jgi:hypothetical protein